MEKIAGELVQLPKRKIRSIIGDPEKSAMAVNLIYVHDNEPGIKRIKNGDQFKYVAGGSKIIVVEEDLERIRSLVIPPAWEDVWICTMANGHLQATGIDLKKRKQYRYHNLWTTVRNHTKYFRLYQFGKVLPAIRLQLEKDLSLPGLPLEKVLAVVVSLMERTNIRIGNSSYEKMYGTYGLTTLKDKHVAIVGTELQFSFKGKKGVHHDISIKNRKLSKIVRACRDIPGKELFQYYTSEGDRRSIDSGMVNEYIRNLSGGDYTAKDFRTWSGTLHAFLAFKELGFFETDTEAKRKIAAAFDMVSAQLGNTRMVCKKYYVHPAIVSLYESKSLEKYLKQLDEIQVNDNKAGLTAEEEVVMKILEAN
ncbi:MAG: DNA topoisomerase IB [Chitinophagaceae bacterium]